MTLKLPQEYWGKEVQDVNEIESQYLRLADSDNDRMSDLSKVMNRSVVKMFNRRACHQSKLTAINLNGDSVLSGDRVVLLNRIRAEQGTFKHLEDLVIELLRDLYLLLLDSQGNGILVSESAAHNSLGGAILLVGLALIRLRSLLVLLRPFGTSRGDVLHC